MKLLHHELARHIQDAIAAAQAAGDLTRFDSPDLEIRASKRAEQGDYNVAVMPLAKPAKMNPFEIAKQITLHFIKPDFLAVVEVAPPGYINFRLDEAWLRQQVETIIAEGDDLFALELGKGKRAQVEFVSANPTAPLHIGRSRGAVVGDTMARLLQAAGFDVEREYYFNNAGAQMRNLGNSLRLRYLEVLGQPLRLSDDEKKTFYQGEYLITFAEQLVEDVGEAWREHDWQPFKKYAEVKMFEMIRQTLARIDIHHDVFFNENSLYDSGAIWETLDALDKRGYVYKAALPENAEPEDMDDANAGKGEAV
ncbi:partial Arginine--tRNA ligase, partial [Anaerolineae bacterium]